MESTRLQQLFELGHQDKTFSLPVQSLEKINSSYLKLCKYLDAAKGPVYGIHTGYGSNVLTLKDSQSWQSNQIELLEYLTVAVGPALSESIVRRALRLQALKISKGNSGIHPQTVDKLIELSNQKELPEVPCFGSLGASGDLIPMAHAVAPIFSDSQKPLGPRDVIGLVNTNSVMSSYAIECWFRLKSILFFSHQVTAMTMRAIDADDDPVTESISSLRLPNDGYRRSAQIITKNLDDLPISEVKNRKWLQPRYSVRCAPMVLGNCWDLLRYAEEKILFDAECVADNPVIIDFSAETQILHAGLFYAASTASAADFMNDIVGKIGEMLDRQILILMDPNLSEGLSENLYFPEAGHLKGLHQMLSALNQQLRALSTSSRNLSFSSEGNNQDIVPGAMAALNQLNSALNVSEEIIRVSLFVALRAYELRLKNSVCSQLRLTSWKSFSVFDTDKILINIKNSDFKKKSEFLNNCQI